MITKVIGGCLLIIGAVICYGANALYRAIKKEQPEQLTTIKLKITGLCVVIAGALVLFLA